jgi:N-acetylmuramoyl-L-alanine amidase
LSAAALDQEDSMIVIDAGHGGRATRGSSHGPGRRGRRGTQEKDVTLALGRAVIDHLGEPAVLTRSGDQNLSLAERQAVAAAHRADVFVSLHAGAEASGVGAYVHPLSNDRSIALGRHLERGAALPYRRRRPLAVLHPWRLPSHTAAAVVEVDTLASADGEARLTDPATLGLYGRRVARAISNYLLTDGGRGRGVVFGAVADARVTCASYPRDYPIFTAIGTDDPVGVIRAANEKAIELLDRVIQELEATRSRILAGEPLAWPTVSDQTAAALRVRMLLDPNDAAVWTGTAPGTVAFVVRWLKNIRKTLHEGHLHYMCLDEDCSATTWAAAIPGQMRIFLCRQWWRGGELKNGVVVGGNPERPLTDEEKLNNRASALIHEASHVYYSTVDDSGLGLGRADCLEQLIADLSGASIPAAYEESCGPEDLSGALSAGLARGMDSPGRAPRTAAAGQAAPGCPCKCAGAGRA